MRYLSLEDRDGQNPQNVPAVGGAQSGAGNQTTPGASKSQFSLPESDVYLNATNAANAAYEKAKGQLLANRNSLYHQYGLTETGATDVNNPYGEYQMLLGSEGRQLDAARDNAVSRGLGSGGLANQGEANLIPGLRLEQLGFQHSVDQAGADYAQGMDNASDQRTGSINQGYQDALMDALSRGLFDPSPTGAATTTTPSGTKTNANQPSPYSPYAVKVTANKTGASANKRQGIFSIH